MNDFKVFLILFFRRLFKPAILVGKKIYQQLPLSIKKHLTSSNFQLITVYCLLFTLLISYFLPRSKIDKNRLAVARWPLSIKKHVQMAKTFFENGSLEKAKLEITKAKKVYQFFKFFDFKGKAKKYLKEGESLINQPEAIKKKIDYWETVLKTKPNFRDVYLRLSLLYYQLYEDEKAKQTWEKAFYLDPNNEVVREVGKELGMLKS